MEKDATVDTIGLYCPVPIMLTTCKMKGLKIGQVLEVLADDPDILEDLPNWCKRSETRFLKLEKEDGFYKLYVRKESER